MMERTRERNVRVRQLIRAAAQQGEPSAMTTDRLRLVVAVLGAFFALQGLGWLVLPARAAEALGMPLLDGVGRSTQIGDFAAFFLTGGLAMVLGSRPGRAALLYFPAALLGAAAVGRTLAWLLHGASFAALFIVVEVVVALVVYRAAGRLDASA
jgi:hypothetical protein